MLFQFDFCVFECYFPERDALFSFALVENSAPAADKNFLWIEAAPSLLNYLVAAENRDTVFFADVVRVDERTLCISILAN